MKNELNVLTYGIWNHKPACWIRNIKLFCRNCKYAAQRIKYGHADCDIWDMDQYLSIVISEMLIDLAKQGNGYPDRYTPESWSEALINAAIDLYDSTNDDGFQEKLDELLDARAMAQACGSLTEYRELGWEIDRLMKNKDESQAAAKERALDWIKENWNNLWD